MPDDSQQPDEASFDDDVDTVPTCTGACCDPVPLPAEDYWDMSRNPKLYKNARYIMNMLVPPQRPVPQHGDVDFACKYFDRETRRCIAYDKRPAMCREFPETGVCGHCGGVFAVTTRRAEKPFDREKILDEARLRTMRSLISMDAEGAHTHTKSTTRRLRRRSG
jgi:Fe-S-cluster containining protein